MMRIIRLQRMTGFADDASGLPPTPVWGNEFPQTPFLFGTKQEGSLRGHPSDGLKGSSPSRVATWAAGLASAVFLATTAIAGTPQRLTSVPQPVSVEDTTTLVLATSPQAPLPPPPPDPKAPKKAPGADACFAVDTITVTGLTLIDRDTAGVALRPFSHPCQGNETIKGLLVSLNALHAAKGYVTTQAYLPKQDIKASRAVRIDIKVGRIADVVYEERPEWAQGSYLDRLNTKLAAVFTADTVDAFFNRLDAFVETIDDPLERPLIADTRGRTAGAVVIGKGDVLNLEEMQQGLDQMNKAASSKAKAKLEPGPDPSTSIVKIVNAPDDAFRLVVGYDTYGTRTTGISRYRAEMARDNLIGVNDTWRSSITSSSGTNEVTGGFAVPYRWLTVGVEAKYSEALTPLSDIAELFSQTASVEVTGTWTALRTPAGRLDLLIGGKVYGNQRYINDILLTPQTFAALELGATRTIVLGQSGLLTLGTKGSLGTEAFDATLDPKTVGKTTPRAQFKKVEGNSNLQWAPLPGITLTSAVTGQWTNAPLYSPDQLTIGTLSAVRGFNAQPFSFDSGAHTKNELAFKLPIDDWFKTVDWRDKTWFLNRLKGLESYVFFDAGLGFDLANDKKDIVAGTGFGLRYKDSRWTVDWSYAQGVYRDNPNLPLSSIMYLNASLKTF
jgi:hemolysin activation/secretion protein